MIDPTNVIISGMHSGPNPSPGLGLARSLRMAGYPGRLIGLDYSAGSSGLHSQLLDEVVRLPPWREIHMGTWRSQIGSLLEEEATVFVPCLDLEVRLLAESFGSHERILAPSGAALNLVGKPPTVLAEAMGLPVPLHEMDVSPRSVARFLRHAPYGAWVKGQHYEAFRAWTAGEAMRLGRFVADTWGTPWHLEAHVNGQECGLAFAARDGELLDAVLMSKVQLTSEGKTWSGSIDEVPSDLGRRLRTILRDTGWTGGGEIELIRSWDRSFTVMELNSRFPAWIHGATVSGVNLPLALVTGEVKTSARDLGSGFTRVVKEIPVSVRVGFPPFRWSAADLTSSASKHPSGMPELGRRWRDIHALGHSGQPSPRPGTTRQVAEDRSEWERVAAPGDMPTPYRQLDPAAFERRVSELREALVGAGEVSLAYSVKTCPHPRLLVAAAALGLAPEVISMDELDAAVKQGMAANRAILNGPAKWWPARSSVSCWAFFADSVAELRSLRRRLDEGFALTAQVVGVRVRAPSERSRFGIRLDLGEVDEVTSLVGGLAERLGAGWGIHFHHASSAIGVARWEREATAALARADGIAARLGISPVLVNIGGGWDHDDLAAAAAAAGRIIRRWTNRPGKPPEFVLEPGKLLTQSCATVITRVLAVDVVGDETCVIVDASLGDLPEGPYRWHPVARYDHSWEPLAAGSGRLLGRSCMEADVLAEGLDLDCLKEGDVVAIGMAGAYDVSMTYDFGRGSSGQGMVTI